MCVTFPIQHMIDQFHQLEQILTLLQNFDHFCRSCIIGCIATHNALICFLGLNMGSRYGLCSELKGCPGIICFKIKNPPPVELCWQKKRNPQKMFNFFGLTQSPAKI
jgi:hypothetical protein